MGESSGVTADQITEKPSRLLWRKHKNAGKGWLQVLLMKTQRRTGQPQRKVNFNENLFGNLGKLSAIEVEARSDKKESRDGE